MKPFAARQWHCPRAWRRPRLLLSLRATTTDLVHAQHPTAEQVEVA
ncbi:MAG: hypothetical protein ABW224_19790 [Kibdelosporangium sp.]